MLYDDGENEKLSMANETWKFESTEVDENTLTASTGASSTLTVTNTEPNELGRMFEFFGNKPFMKFQAQGFEQFVLSKAYKSEEDVLLKTVEVIPREKVPKNANVIRSHSLYMIKVNDDGSMKLKARIAPYGNELHFRVVLFVES